MPAYADIESAAAHGPLGHHAEPRAAARAGGRRAASTPASCETTLPGSHGADLLHRRAQSVRSARRSTATTTTRTGSRSSAAPRSISWSRALGLASRRRARARLARRAGDRVAGDGRAARPALSRPADGASPSTTCCTRARRQRQVLALSRDRRAAARRGRRRRDELHGARRSTTPRWSTRSARPTRARS